VVDAGLGRVKPLVVRWCAPLDTVSDTTLDGSTR
jgi:hypothetical protein